MGPGAYPGRRQGPVGHQGEAPGDAQQCDATAHHRVADRAADD